MRTITTCTILGCILFVGCQPQVESNPLEGTWELVKGEYRSEDGIQSFPETEHEHHMKIITKTHFATVWQDTSVADGGGFNGGAYTFVNGLYSEHLEYFSATNNLGLTVHFKVRFEGDRFFMSPATADGKDEEYGFFEEWKGIGE